MHVLLYDSIYMYSLNEKKIVMSNDGNDGMFFVAFLAPTFLQTYQLCGGEELIRAKLTEVFRMML